MLTIFSHAKENPKFTRYNLVYVNLTFKTKKGRPAFYLRQKLSDNSVVNPKNKLIIYRTAI